MTGRNQISKGNLRGAKALTIPISPAEAPVYDNIDDQTKIGGWECLGVLADPTSDL